jgi:small subunit ribosomal protein S17
MADTAEATSTATRPQMRTRQGVVAGDAADKTIRVQINYQTKHEKYGKYLTRRTVIQCHDEQNEAKQGDTVVVAECRPLSKTKHHRLVRIVERGPDNR